MIHIYNMYLSPKRVKQGSRVAVVAPASAFSPEELLVGLDIIKECGLIPILGPCVKNVKTFSAHSATVQERAEELNWAFSDPHTMAVICAIGGEGSAALLPYLDYDRIKTSRKAFLGKSDLTSISCGILEKSGLITINGKTPSIHVDKSPQAFDNECESFKRTLQLLMSDQPWGDSPFSNNKFLPRTVSHGHTQGIAVGGNCDTFSRLLGTDFFPNVDGAILFLEDVHKTGTSLSRQFLQLKLAGVFERVNGIVLGEFAEVPESYEKRPRIIDEVITEYFSNGPPCVYGYTFSHGDIVSPIPIGAMCHLDADDGHVSFDFRMASAY